MPEGTPFNKKRTRDFEAEAVIHGKDFDDSAIHAGHGAG